MNTEQLLLRGFSNLYATVGIETLVGGGNWFTQSLRSSSLKPVAFGQVEEHHHRAKINWLLCLNNDQQTVFPHLIDNLAFEVGLHGAKFLCASATQDSLLFELFRHSGYCVYGWKKYWKLISSIPSISFHKTNRWTRTNSIDTHDIVKFQHKHLPPTVRSVAPLANELLPELILKENDEIKAYAFIKTFGNKGIISPIVAIDLKNWKGAFYNLLNFLPNSVSTWFLVQSTSHDWLEDSLGKYAIPVTDRLELLVKYFAVVEKTPVGLLTQATNGSHPDPVTPFIHTSNTKDNL